MAAVEPDAATIARVKTLAAAEQRPALTDAEVIAAIKDHPRVDRDGLWADDPAWTPTWDLNLAASDLWGIKAGKVAGDFNFSADGASYNKGDVMAQCLEMEAKYAARSAGSAATGAYADQDPLKGVIVNG